MFDVRRSSIAAAALCAVAMSARAAAPQGPAVDGPSFSEAARAHLPPAVVDAAREARDVVIGTEDAAPQTHDATQLTVVPAVPEPETYALMLAGLGVLGAAARRRAKRRAAGARS